MATKKASKGRKASAPSNSAASNSQTTGLTPNSNCVAVGSGDSNNSTTVSFFAPQNGINWWTATVSNAGTSATLGSDQGNGVVTFQKGLTINYRASGTSGAYNVTLTGNITDYGTVYTFTNSVIYMSTGASSGQVSISRKS